VRATGSEIAAVLSGAAKAGLRPPASQQSRPDEVALFVSQYSVMSSSTSSGDFSGSLLLYASAATINGKGIGNVVPN
jgi:hypothetical protein